MSSASGSTTFLLSLALGVFLHFLHFLLFSFLERSADAFDGFSNRCEKYSAKQKNDINANKKGT